MSIKSIKIDKKVFDINLKFYSMLKYLIKASLKESDIKKLLVHYSLYKNLSFTTSLNDSYSIYFGQSKSSLKKQDYITNCLELIENILDLELFIFSLKLIAIKPLLLQEAKTRDLLDSSKLPMLNPLSLAYDKITTFTPYSTRVSGALLSLIFFDKLESSDTIFLSSDTTDFLKILSIEAIKLKNAGLEPNQIFMLMFSESINQSITSDSGSNYEERILSVLKSLGISGDEISKTHDKDDKSTEFDFFFSIENKTYGISAKRTLRERYKQFIKTSLMSTVNVMIEITLGIDLTEEKVKSIRQHGVYLFVADEVYENNEYLRKAEGVYSAKNLTLETLRNLSK